ncbi:MAG TPA: DUF6178 family protein [Kofleriaceae bacterium]|nr:DUF6178 family protein [Kofleriaceae bacterium]
MRPTEHRESPIIPLSRFRAALARPQGAKLVAALLEGRDPAAQVAALSATELYLLVREVGLADAGDLLALATPEQFRGIVDIDAWTRDRLEADKVLPWLAALLDSGYERTTQMWERLDPELSALLFARNTRIFDLSLGEDPDDEPADEALPVVRTPDTFFAVRITTEDAATQAILMRLIDFLYRGDMQVARHTLMAARSEPQSQLEEMSYRWRSGRLADLGYVEHYAALSIYELLDPEAIQVGENSASVTGGGVRLPALFAGAIFGREFLARALERITDAADAERLEMALVVLVNHVLAADAAQPGDAAAMATAAERATATLALGLETVAGGDLEVAAEALRTVALSRLFRAGHTITVRLSHLATPFSLRARALDDPAPAIVEALTARPRPAYPAVLDEPPQDGARAFSSARDIARAAAAIADIAARIAIAEAVGVDVAAIARAEAPPFTADTLVRTAILAAAWGRPLLPTPMAAADLPAILTAVRVDGHLSPGARAAAEAALQTAAEVAGAARAIPGLAATIRGLIDSLETAIASLDPAAIDPRFVAADLAIV